MENEPTEQQYAKIENKEPSEAPKQPDYTPPATQEKPAFQPAVPAVTPSARPTAATSSVDDIVKSVEDTRVRSLIDISMHEGVLKALEKASIYNDAYLLDKFHDELVKISAALIKNKKIAEE